MATESQVRTLPGRAAVVPTRRAAWPRSSRRVDGAMLALSCWGIGGAMLDAWAHANQPALETFFTPWHAVLYSGFGVMALFLGGLTLGNHRAGYPWARSVPAAYRLALLGVACLLVGGPGDLLWHLAFGIERGMEAALSPTHLLLAAGIVLLISTPLQVAWSQASGRAPGWAALFPAVLSAGLALALISLLTEYGNPLVRPWPTLRTAGTTGEALGIVSVLLQTVLLLGSLLLLNYRWRLPLGACTFLFALNAALLSVVSHQYGLILVAGIGGAVADALLARVHDARRDAAALRWFAVGTPLAYYLSYFAVLGFTSGLTWPVHIWAGTIVLAMLTGLFLSYLRVPPALPEHTPAPPDEV
jgi:hypothetical protein